MFSEDGKYTGWVPKEKIIKEQKILCYNYTKIFLFRKKKVYKSVFFCAYV